MSGWYYVQDNQQQGPVPEANLIAMLAHHVLPPETRVWAPELGGEWRLASQTRLIAPAAPLSQPTIDQEPDGELAPTAAAKFPRDDRFAKMIAFSPALIMIIDIGYALAGYDPMTAPVGGPAIYMWIWIAQLFIAARDNQYLKATGHNPGSKRLVPFLLLTQIGYFWRRSVISGAPFTLLWVWSGLLIASAVLTAVLFP